MSGAPTWPDAAVNSGVAARTGKTQVVICARPQAVFFDRRPVTVNPGKPLVTADGTQITAAENVYLIWGSNGNWVRAAVNPGYIDVKVGLGQWPIAAKGLLANVRNDPNLLATRQGQVLRNPVSFEELYHSYTDSWRVSRADSMLDVCGEMGKAGIPGKPLFVQDLDRDLAARGRAICAKAGLKEGALLDACILDVAVIGPRAAEVYARTPAPYIVHRLR